MPKYDAFGREIGEDTLANWRSQSPAPPIPEEETSPSPSPLPVDDSPPPAVEREPEPPPEAEPAPAPTPAIPQLERLDIPSGPQPTVAAPRVKRRRPRVVSRLIILLVVLVVTGNLIAGAVTKVQDTIDGIPDFKAPGGGAQAKPPPVGLQPGSLIRPAAFEKAMKKIQDRGLGRLQTLRLAPERINAALLTPRTTLVSVQLSHDGQFQQFGETGGGFGNLDTIPFPRLDPRAPQRLVRAAAAKLNRPTTKIDYLVPSISSGQITWGAYFKGGAIFFGDAHGRLTRRIS